MRPIEKIPDSLLDEYSMNGLVEIKYKYRDDSTEEVQRQIANNFTSEAFNRYYRMAKRRESNYYGKTDKWLHEALSDYRIKCYTAIVFGSACPWYEAIAIRNGVERCDVLEYSPRADVHPRVRYCKEDELAVRYDVALSISSFEHYGLGRYGDPIGPNSDLIAMEKVKGLLKDGGLLCLSVPIGVDAVYWNVHRVYGEHRFPVLIDGFDMIDSYGFDEGSFKRTDNGAKGTPYQPVFVLRKR